MKKEDQFKELLQKPVNILKKGKWRSMVVSGVRERVWLPSGEEILSRSGIMDWQEDLLHLQNQLTVEQPGSALGVDQRQAKRDRRKLRESIVAEQLRKEEVERKLLSKTVVSVDEGDDEIEDELNDENFEAPVKKSKRLNVMGPMSTTADRLNVSCRKMAMLGSAAVKSVGVNLSDTNISVTSAWRHRTKNRLDLAASIKQNYNPCKILSLHWDGKTLKLRRGVKGNFIAIYVSGVQEGNPKQLLGIPLAPDGTGREEFEVIKAALEDWKIQNEIVAIVFDTTLSNTGEFGGVCR